MAWRALLVAVAWVLPGAGSALERDVVILQDPSAQTSVTVTVEIADTPQARAQGLMGRARLAEDAGMLFVYRTPRQISMWMHNTPLPLDMLFFRGGRLLYIEHEAEPFTRTARGPFAPMDRVLEVNAGFARRHGIERGWRLIEPSSMEAADNNSP